MFTDHMLFSRVTELLGVLVMLYSFAMSIRIQSRNPFWLNPASGSWTSLNNKFYFFALRNCGALSSNDFRFGAHVAGKNCNLFPAGRRAFANGKEETSC